jgi:DNA-binding transcriptional regulator YhcF (GntR family)
MNLKIDGHSPIPIRRQLTEQLRHVIESGGVPQEQALPSIRRRPPDPPHISARGSCKRR